MGFRTGFGGLAVLVVLASGGVAGAQAQMTPGVSVNGQGRVAVTPDIARLSLGVRAEDATASAAMAQASDAMAGVLSTLADLGITGPDVQTTTLSVQPIYRDREAPDAGPRVIGYGAASDLQVTVRDLTGLGAVIDGVIGAGGNTFSGISFDLADRSAALIEARRLAVADAMAKAALFAGAADVILGPVVEIVEGGSGGRPMPMMESASFRGAAMPVAQGEVEISADVSMRFALTE